MSEAPGVAIIGCGFIGQRRARALAGARLRACADLDERRARALAEGVEDCFATTDWRAAIHRSEVGLVIVATRHDTLAAIAGEAIASGRHVLVEKPAARRRQELQPLIGAAERSGSMVRVGFNHRYHRAFRKARELVDSGAVGDLMFIRARYGHGGRIGYDREWRANPVQSGGGELIDQGTHLIDLARWFLGDFNEIEGCARTFYWDMPVDDNGFLLLTTSRKQVAFLHASCTEWKNLFSFEIYGKLGKLEVSGLGGSYGVERLSFYRMLPEMGPPETTTWEYPMSDDSWTVEFAEFLEDIRLGRAPAIGLNDAIAALSIVETIYRSSGYDHHS
jgi:predicted dehydrogenase